MRKVLENGTTIYTFVYVLNNINVSFFDRIMPERGFSRMPIENDNILMKDLLQKVLERRKIENRGKFLDDQCTLLCQNSM